MRKLYTFLFLMFSLAILSELDAQTFHPDYLDGNIYLKVKDSSSVTLVPYNNGIPALNLIISSFGIDSIYHPFRNPDASLQRIYRLEFTSILGVNTLISQLEALSFVEYAEKVPLMQTTGTTFLPNDLQASQWALTKIQAPLAWDISTGSNQVVVAIIDNAFRTTHEDLASAYYVNSAEIPNNFLDDDFNGYIDDAMGYDLADMDGNVNPPATTPDWDHGTHCAGLVGAETNNGIGIASIGFGIRILPVKASSDVTGGNTLEKAYESVDYAMNNGANVISMSWGSKGQSLTGELLLSVARSNGIVLIAAAGNNNDSIPFYPAASASTLAVGATDFADLRSNFSNYGSYVDVMAPGTDIYSCLADANNAYGQLSGTSMACPIVAGLAGLIMSSGNYSETQVKQMIIGGCENIDALNPGFAGKLGAGRINAYNSLNMANGIESEGEWAAVQVFPNPCHEFLNISLPANFLGKAQLKVFDLTGKQLLQFAIQEESSKFSVAELNSGLYILQLESGGKTYNQRLQIN